MGSRRDVHGSGGVLRGGDRAVALAVEALEFRAELGGCLVVFTGRLRESWWYIRIGTLPSSSAPTDAGSGKGGGGGGVGAAAPAAAARPRVSPRRQRPREDESRHDRPSSCSRVSHRCDTREQLDGRSWRLSSSRVPLPGGTPQAAPPQPAPAAPTPPPPPPLPDPASVGADELGSVPILMYHQLSAQPAGEYDQTPAEFRAELERLHREGYRPITAAQYAAGTVDIPAGTHPVVLTFDDSTTSQLRLTADGAPAPDCAVAILEEFAARHPDSLPAPPSMSPTTRSAATRGPCPGSPGTVTRSARIPRPTRTWGRWTPGRTARTRPERAGDRRRRSGHRGDHHGVAARIFP